MAWYVKFLMGLRTSSSMEVGVVCGVVGGDVQFQTTTGRNVISVRWMTCGGVSPHYGTKLFLVK